MREREKNEGDLGKEKGKVNIAVYWLNTTDEHFLLVRILKRNMFSCIDREGVGGRGQEKYINI